MITPEVPHADLIARLRHHEASWSRISLSETCREAADALAALSDTVPRAQYEQMRADRFSEGWTAAHAHFSPQITTAERERDEARAERDAAQKEVQWREDWENKVIVHLHPNWEDDIAQIALLTNFIEHAAKLDSVIEDAREADGYEGNALTFTWDDDTRTLSAVSLALHDAEVWEQAAEFVDEQREDFDGDLRQVRDRIKSRAAAIREETK